METTLFYARAALPPKGHFYYHQGVFFPGC